MGKPVINGDAGQHSWGGWKSEAKQVAMGLRVRAHEIDPGGRAIAEPLRLIEEAEGVLERPRHPWTGWVTGSDRDHVWACLHQTEELLAREFRTEREWVVSVVREHERDIDRADPASVIFEQGLTRPNERVGAAAQEVLQRAHECAYLRDRNARMFRNRLLTAAILPVLAAAALLAVQVELPGEALVAAPAGSKLVPWQLTALALAGGLIGGLIGAARMLTATTQSCYPSTGARALLRATMGTFTGYLGVVLVDSGWIVNGTVTSTSMLFLLAIAFGYQQRVISDVIETKLASFSSPKPTTQSAAGNEVVAGYVNPKSTGRNGQDLPTSNSKTDRV